MNTHAEIVQELRSLFKEGATPSRLVLHIVERHATEPTHHALIQAYFLEAFGIPIVRGLNPRDDYEDLALRYAFLNEQLVHEIIQRRCDWDVGIESGINGSESWLATLEATDTESRMKQAQAKSIPELNRCWSLLTPSEQSFVQRTIATSNGLYETVKILSRLTECLQQQVIELQTEPTGTDRG